MRIEFGFLAIQQKFIKKEYISKVPDKKADKLYINVFNFNREKCINIAVNILKKIF